MDFGLLSESDLDNFLSQHNVNTNTSYEKKVDNAGKLFNTLLENKNAVYPYPVVDLYMSYKLKTELEQSSEREVLNERISRIIQFLESYLFESPTGFTGNTNTDIQILVSLDDVSLRNICKTNKYIQSLCNEDLLWEIKSSKSFGDDVKKFREDGTTPILNKQDIYYFNLLVDDSLTSVFSKIQKGLLHPDALVWFINFFGIKPTKTDANIASFYGNLDTVKILYSEFGVLPDEWGLSLAIMNRSYDIVEWLTQKRIFPSQYMINSFQRFFNHDGYYNDILKYYESMGIKGNNGSYYLGDFTDIRKLDEYNKFQKMLEIASLGDFHEGELQRRRVLVKVGW